MLDLTGVFNKLTLEHNLNSFVVDEFKVADHVLKNITVVSNNNFDYIVFLELDFDKLKYINNDIQVALATNFKDHLYGLGGKTEITHFFEKNTYLVVSTKHPDEILDKDLFKEVSIVEEDLYFFKKQIIYYSAKEFESLKINDLNLNFTVYFNDVVSNISRYEKYLNGQDDEYKFIVKLFEKLPFMKLEIEEKELLNLDKMIADSLSEQELEILPELLQLTSDISINNWVKTLGHKND